jgi:PhnB protein
MRVMVVVKATPSSEAGQLPSAGLLQAMGAYNEELVKAGIMQAGEGLKASSEGVRVRFQGSQRLVTHGPFAETSELIAGFWLWQVASMEEAIEWVERCPNPMPEDSDIEIRPLYETEDFAACDTDGKVAAHEAGLRTQLAMQNCAIQPYLFFSGRCEEALDFYQQALGAKVIMKMRFEESPDPTPPGMLQPGFEKKIMHAAFKVGDMLLMASDGCDDKTNFQGFRLALSLDGAEACDQAFDALAVGGRVDMPLCQTFWSARFGMLTDKFNVGWMIMVKDQVAP